EHRRAVAVLLRDFIEEEPAADCYSSGRHSMFRTARPSAVTLQLREAIADRLERALMAGASAHGAERQHPRPVVAVAGQGLKPSLRPSPSWCSDAAGKALASVLAAANPDPTPLKELAARLEAALPFPAKVVPYGSIISRFADRDADADLSVLPEQCHSRQLQQRVLVELRQELLKRGWHVSAIGLGGRVPVLTLYWAEGTADVTVGNQLGVYKSELLREYSMLDRRLCDLVIAVKRWAKLRQISGQTRGYLGGYAWTLLALAFAQTVAVPSLQAMATPKIWTDTSSYNVAWAAAQDVSKGQLDWNGWTSAGLLHGFFSFFDETFDFHRESASVRLGCRAVRVGMDRPDRPRYRTPPRLSLEDPIETDWDLGAILDAPRLARLRAELRRASRRLRAAVIKDLPRQAQLGQDEVRISARAASLNFPELLMMQNKYQYKPQLPFVLCTEGAGVVTEVGSKVTKFHPGDRVFYATLAGCAREEMTLSEQMCVPLPDALSFSQGASFHMGYTTGYHGLVTRGRLQAGEWLLVTGAGGGMGTMAVELGKAVGAKVIAAASSDDKLEVCKKLGADYVVNYSKQKLKDAVGEITKGHYCDVIYDPVGGEIFDQCVRCVAPKGYARLLVVGFASGTIPKFGINMALIKGFDLVGVRSGAQLGLEPELAQQTMLDLLKLATDGKLKPYISTEFPLDRFRDAFRLMEQRKVVGKCCITLGQSKL
ncbi:unnamed protein product, partial [Effrenium voratum]